MPLVTNPTSGTVWPILFSLVNRSVFTDLPTNLHALMPFWSAIVITLNIMFKDLSYPSSSSSSSSSSLTSFNCKGVSPWGPFWDHSLEHWKESLKRPEKVLFLRYEKMKRDPTFHLRRLAEFIGCPFSEEEEAKHVVENILKPCSFYNLSNLEANKKGKLSSGMDNKAFFRRGEVGDWVNYLTTEMARKLDSIVGKKLHGSGLKF